MSLQNVDVVRGTSSFIGLGNYLRLFHDGQFGLSVLNTAWYTLTVVPLIVIGSIAIAVPPAATATGTFMMRQYIVGIPDELLEAARIDGASDWKIYRHIILPLSAPALGAVGILSFTWRWNDYLWPLIVIGDQKNFTLQLSLANLVGTNTVEWGTLLAYATLAMLPVLVVFLCFQRYFLKGSWSGGVKG